MTESNESTSGQSSAGTAPAEAGNAPKKRGGLNSLLIADLRSMAGGLGVAGIAGMKKAQLVEAIKAVQSGSGSARPAGSGPPGAGGDKSPTVNARKRTGGRSRSAAVDTTNETTTDTRAATAGDGGEDQKVAVAQEPPAVKVTRRTRNKSASQDAAQSPAAQSPAAQSPAAQSPAAQSPAAQTPAAQTPAAGATATRGQQRVEAERPAREEERKGSQQSQRQPDTQSEKSSGSQQSQRQPDTQSEKPSGSQQSQRHPDTQSESQHESQSGTQQDAQNREEQGTGRNRRRRGRDRSERTERTERPERNARGNRNEPDTTILEDDVLVPAAGILDVLDNYAFVRTSGYLPGVDDVYVSLSMVRKFGLRRGDAIVGQVRQPREGERKEKFNPMVRIDAVNGADPESARSRVDFSNMTPLYPTERLRLETGPADLIGRVIDIVAPIGKGQRGLIVAPAKAGKTMILQSIANSISTNNPECHLMVVLVDERPEEVTDFERSVKGEVISSTFDRPASDHTTVAELAIERAKRLVELGHDVVVLLDGITRLGRAYNLVTPASGRVLSGGVDSAALYPPKKFFGAARNIEDGGSLTILATALVESGSKVDEVIFEEFNGTANLEIQLRSDLADKRIFPAIDAVASGTRREERLLNAEELAIVWKLRRLHSGLGSQEALELLLGRLKKSQTNIEFLMGIQQSSPTSGASD